MTGSQSGRPTRQTAGESQTSDASEAVRCTDLEEAADVGIKRLVVARDIRGGLPLDVERRLAIEDVVDAAVDRPVLEAAIRGHQVELAVRRHRQRAAVAEFRRYRVGVRARVLPGQRRGQLAVIPAQARVALPAQVTGTERL